MFLDIVNIFEKFDYHPIHVGEDRYAIYEEGAGPDGEPGLNVVVIEVRPPTDSERELFIENLRKLNDEGGY